MYANPPKALLFDVFGSLCDWRSGVGTEVGKAFADKPVSPDPLRFAELWRGRYQPAMQRIRGGDRGYVPLDILHRENLDLVLKSEGLEDHLNSAERDALNHAWEKLPPWPEVPGALAQLRGHAFIAPCSNGSIALMVRLARFANLPWDMVLGAEIAQNYKPERSVYLASCKALGLAPGEVMMVAAHNDDLFAARKAGLLTGFFPRPTEHGRDQVTDLEPEADWDFIGSDLSGLVSIFV